MIYRKFDDLCGEIMRELDKAPALETTEERAEWIRAQPNLMRLGDLLRAYNDALYNPPDGVIGVGAVTYAEGVLLEKQQS